MGLRRIIVNTIQVKVAIVKPEDAALYYDHRFQSCELARALELLADEEAFQSLQALVPIFIGKFMFLIHGCVKWRVVASEKPRRLVREGLGIWAKNLAGTDLHA